MQEIERLQQYTVELTELQQGLQRAKPGVPGGADLFPGELYRSLNITIHASPNAEAGDIFLAV